MDIRYAMRGWLRPPLVALSIALLVATAHAASEQPPDNIQDIANAALRLRQAAILRTLDDCKAKGGSAKTCNELLELTHQRELKVIARLQAASANSRVNQDELSKELAACFNFAYVESIECQSQLADRLDAAASGQPLVKGGGSAKTAMSAEHSWELRGLRLGDDVQTALSPARAIGPGSEFIPRKDPDLPGTIASLWKLGDDLCGWAAATPCERYKLMFPIEPSNSRLFRIDLIQSFGSKGVSSKEVISNLRTALGKESRYTTTSYSFGDKTVLLTWSEKPLPPNMQITAMTLPVDFTQGGKVAVAELHYRLGSDRLQGITFYLMDLDLMLENLQRAKDIGLLPGTPKPNTHF